MIQIYHEAPLQIFDKVQEVTDGDYALVHLLHRCSDYDLKFVNLSRQPRTRPLILDNSAFELGKAFSPDLLAGWIEILQPDIYVVPDTMGEAEQTVDAFRDWCNKYPKLPGKKMGVLQGASHGEAVRCFNALVKAGADIIGIPYLLGAKFDEKKATLTDLMWRRQQLMKLLLVQGKPHPIHILGVALPQDGYQLKKMPWIVSVDTSNPVIHGMFGIGYKSEGLSTKISTLLADVIHNPIDEYRQGIIFENIASFKRIWL